MSHSQPLKWAYATSLFEVSDPKSSSGVVRCPARAPPNRASDKGGLNLIEPQVPQIVNINTIYTLVFTANIPPVVCFGIFEFI